MFSRTTERDLVPDRQELQSLPPRVKCILSAEIDIIRAPYYLRIENQTLGGGLPFHPQKRYIASIDRILFVFRGTRVPCVIWLVDSSTGHRVVSGSLFVWIGKRHTRQNGNQETRLL